MADDRRDDMIEKVRALMKQADHPNTGYEEARVFRAKAADLMAKYQIDHITISESGVLEDEIVIALVKLDGARPLMVPDERMMLIHGITKPFDCRGIVKLIDGETFYEVWGYKHDAEMLRMLYATCVVDLVEGLLTDGVKMTVNWQRSYAEAYALKIVGMVLAMRGKMTQIAESTSGSMALVLASKLSQVQAKFDDTYPPEDMQKVRRKTFKYDRGGAAKGSARAAKADVGGNAKVEGTKVRGELG